jgi:PEP-CTERM motif
MRALRQTIAASMLFAGLCSAASAGVLVDTIGVGGDTLHSISSRAVAQSFVATGTGIGDVEIALGLTGSATGSILLTLSTDSLNAPGTVIDTVSSLAETNIPSNAETLFDFNNLPIDNLTAGSKYWLSVTKAGTIATDVYITTQAPAVGNPGKLGNPGDTDYWKGVSTGLISPFLVICISDDNSCGAAHAAAFTFGVAPAPPPAPTTTLSSSDVPEPATLTIMGIGMAGLGLIRRRRGAQTGN